MKLTTKYLLFLAMGLFELLFSCNAPKQKPISTGSGNIKLEEITSHMDKSDTGAWNDIFLKIIGDKQTDSSHIYGAKGLYHDKTVGLQFEVKQNMGAGLKDGQISGGGMTYNGVRISSIGKESDEFIKALAELYKFPTAKSFTTSTITTTAFSLNNKEADLDGNGYYHFKLFFNENSEALYAELFFNIDLTKQIIELPEKDEGYRENIIKAMTN